MRVCFTGYYGQRNYGDDLFVAAASWAARREWGEHSYSVAAPSVELASEGIRFLVPRESARRFAEHGVRGRLYRARVKLPAQLSSDLVVLAGGSLLTGLPVLDTRRLQGWLARWTDRELGGLGLSVGPFSSSRDRDAVARLLGRYSFLGLRDRRSYEEALALGLSPEPLFGADLAAVLLDHPDFGPGTAKPGAYLGVNILSDARMTELGVDRVALLDTLVRVCRDSGLRPRIFVLDDHPATGEEEASRALAAELGERLGTEVALTIRGRDGVVSIWREMAGCSAVFSMRLHGGITAYLHGVPFVLFEYHRKCADFLADVGKGEALRIRRGSSAEEVERALRLAVEQPPEPGLPVSEYRGRALGQFSRARRLSEKLRKG